RLGSARERSGSDGPPSPRASRAAPGQGRWWVRARKESCDRPWTPPALFHLRGPSDILDITCATYNELADVLSKADGICAEDGARRRQSESGVALKARGGCASRSSVSRISARPYWRPSSTAAIPSPASFAPLRSQGLSPIPCESQRRVRVCQCTSYRRCKPGKRVRSSVAWVW